MQYSIAQYSTVQYDTVYYSIVQYSIVCSYAWLEVYLGPADWNAHRMWFGFFFLTTPTLSPTVGDIIGRRVISCCLYSLIAVTCVYSRNSLKVKELQGLTFKHDQ